jgi:hypothetical protein
MGRQERPISDAAELATHHPVAMTEPETVHRRRLLVRPPGKWAAMIAGAEGLMVATFIICGERVSWARAIGDALFFGLGFFLIGGSWLWFYFWQWNITEESSGTSASLAGMMLVPMGLFRALFTLIIVAVTIAAVAQVVTQGLPEAN